MLISLRPIGEGSGSNVDVDDDFVVEVVLVVEVVVVFVVTIVEGAFILSLMSNLIHLCPEGVGPHPSQVI